MVGVSTHTIRAWEHRHGILQPQRTSAKQRRYSLDDIQLLREVKRAIDVNGLSLRVAFESVVSGSKSGVAALPTGGRTIPDYVLPSGDTGVWRAVADILPQLLILIDRDGAIVEANSAVARTFGVVRQKVAGRQFASLVDPFDRAKAVLLYRPRPRTVERWELNMATADGPRLYSFRSWLVRRDGDVVLALIGAEMFTPSAAEDVVGITQTSPASTPDSTAAPVSRNAFQALVEQFPFGVAVASIGADPRIVYANVRLSRMLGIAPSTLTARPVAEVLPPEQVERSLHQSVASRTVHTLKNVEVRRGASSNGKSNHFDIEFQPLFSSTHKVVSVMIVLEEAAVLADDKMKHLLAADHRLDKATTPRQLGAFARAHLSRVLPDVPFALAVSPPTASGDAVDIQYSPAVSARGRGAAALMRTRLAEAAAGGVGGETVVTLGGRAYTLTARPLSSTRKSGGLAWLSPEDAPTTLAQKRALDVVLADLAIATELLHLRTEFARKESRLKAFKSTVSVISDSRGQAALGIRFLQRLCRVLHADGAAIGRIVGRYYEVEAAYAADGASAKPGDRFPLSGQFTQTSFETGRPVASREIGSPGLPRNIRNAVGKMRQAVAVPLVFMGSTTHVITLLRKADRPFDADDVEFVKSLSSIALLAVTPPGRSRPPSQRTR